MTAKVALISGDKRRSHYLSGTAVENLGAYIFHMRNMNVHIMIIDFGIFNYFTSLK